MGILGITHLAVAILAMIFGAIVIFMKKGTKTHVKIGYAYVVSMVGVNVTALMIYNLFGKFGPFHYAALISLLSVMGGMIPAIRRKPKGRWIEMHYEFMNWSVIGLYAAFWSETFTRYFRFQGFWVLVATATALTVAIGAYLLKSKKAQILAVYGYTTKKGKESK